MYRNNIEKNIDLKVQYRTKNLSDPISIQAAASKKYLDNNFNDPSVIKDTAHVDFNDEIRDNVRFVIVNSKPTLEEHLTSKLYVDQAISDGVDEESLLRLDPDEKLELEEQNSLILNSTLTLPKTIIEIPAKTYVDRSFIDPSMIRNSAHVDFNDKNLDNVRFIKVNSLTCFSRTLNSKNLSPSSYIF